ncbi:amino acid ABC transporter substrate-binding protein [Cyanobacterium stanieri LEGE 03274]|uniref:Amino acid ABC transporter substrate-binding protein n=1 Tax=Cyanobacterium stanieri LEGE 03274 TaxID=1828756 RepID=A0ABR9V5F6_9CHRO|nr:ABC transporter substrate-binding protein [Cyanobacterium stanieri]MBE9223122.1 amino acid ABC transporter substrate-binding protein [Cyanobacterium stanieri LEGE 03274]
MTTILRPWICDGTPKNGLNYPRCLGSHGEVENFTDICPFCLLPREAGKSVFTGVDITAVGKNEGYKSRVSQSENVFSEWFLLLRDKGLMGVWLFLIMGIFLGVILANLSRMISHEAVVTVEKGNFLISSFSGDMEDFFSQGEKIFFEVNPLKQMAADAFRQGDWQSAIALYNRYIEDNGNDYEAQIYRQNAIARSRGNPITLATTIRVDKENNTDILSPLARYQQEFNQQNQDKNQRLLEIVIVNYQGANMDKLSQNILNTNDIIGILDLHFDQNSYTTLSIYENQGLGIISPINFQWHQTENKLQYITPENREKVYLNIVTNTLLNYANSLNSSPNVILFYDSESDYSIKFKSSILENLPQWQGNLIIDIDVSQNANPEQILQTLGGANTIVMALGENRLSQAMAISRENNYFLPILVSEDLFNNNTLIQGKETVDQWVMALPWGYSPDVFANEQIIPRWSEDLIYDIFKETITAPCEGNMCGLAINAHRGNFEQLLQEGIKLSHDYNRQDSLLHIPLVQIVPDFEGLSDTGYRFEIKTIDSDH